MQERNGLLKTAGSFILAASLIGCAAAPVAPAKEVDIKVPVWCQAVVPPSPSLDTPLLTPDTTDADTARAYVNDMATLIADDIQLRNSLKSCLKPAASSSPGSLTPVKNNGLKGL